MILWPDTFCNHFHPEVPLAAVEVLEQAGAQVVVPQTSLCRGRPPYHFGMLETAKRLLRQILDTLKPAIEAGIPIVGLEPSCIAVFHDELANLFPFVVVDPPVWAIPKTLGCRHTAPEEWRRTELKP